MKPLVLLTACIVLAACQSSDVASPSGPYFPKVRAIVQANCVSCHSQAGTGEPKGLPVMLETDEQIASLAEAIKAATNDPVSPRNKRMPYGGELSSSDKSVIRLWFAKGGRVTD